MGIQWHWSHSKGSIALCGWWLAHSVAKEGVMGEGEAVEDKVRKPPCEDDSLS